MAHEITSVTIHALRADRSLTNKLVFEVLRACAPEKVDVFFGWSETTRPMPKDEATMARLDQSIRDLLIEEAR